MPKNTVFVITYLFNVSHLFLLVTQSLVCFIHIKAYNMFDL